ncbi:Gem-associated protein 6 [Phytophthora megakarya]|uniref:Gem-associated protein 6 n=1 Tax=Phytophthora megakarya TaxID=4795 RepID=A0A225X1N5_9STRA|nr:Gem-associated protein 6 [Phytophthora megakarya]
MAERSLFDQFSSLIGHPARLQLQDGTSTDGVLYCIDPETDHVALLCPLGHGDCSYNVKMVLAHHIRDIEKMATDDLPTVAELQQKLGAGRHKQEDFASSLHRREQLEQFLTKSFVPFEVTADGSICVFGGAATVRAPFRVVQCVNESLLRRMQQLLMEFDQQRDT